MFRKNFVKALTAVVLVAALALPTLGAMSDAYFVKLCKTGTAQQVADAIKAGANVNAKYNTKVIFSGYKLRQAEIVMTALMAATADNENTEVIKILLKAGADVNEKNNHGLTALMIAALNNQKTEIVKTLINAGAKSNAKKTHAWIPFTSAVFKNKNKNTEAVKILLKAGADVNAMDKQGMTALDYAQGSLLEVIEAIEKQGGNENKFKGLN